MHAGIRVVTDWLLTSIHYGYYLLSLCEKLFRHQNSPDGTMDMNVAAVRMGTPKRRLYDICAVLVGVGVLERFPSEPCGTSVVTDKPGRARWRKKNNWIGGWAICAPTKRVKKPCPCRTWDGPCE